MASNSAASAAAASKRIVVLISGSGSNLQAILDATTTSTTSDGGGGGGALAKLNAKVTQVISNRKAAYGLQRAAKVGIATAVLSLKTWMTKNAGKTREEYDAVLAHAVLAGARGRSAEALQGDHSEEEDDDKPDLVVLAGFMHIVSPSFLESLRGVPCINLHPALPGQFDGIDAIKRAHDAFAAGTLRDDKTGVMVHEVVAEVDRGTPVVVREVKCAQGETLEQLEERIHAVEHEIIVEAVHKVLTR